MYLPTALVITNSSLSPKSKAAIQAEVGTINFNFDVPEQMIPAMDMGMYCTTGAFISRFSTLDGKEPGCRI